MNWKGITEYAVERNARQLATAAHTGQKYDEGPYFNHLSAVVSILRETERWGEKDYSWDVIAAAWLHDTLEDTLVTPSLILALCGKRVLELVSLVTDKAGSNRRERHEATYPLLKADVSAVRIKLADRISHVMRSHTPENAKYMEMYLKEREYFREMLYTKGENEDLWARLDKAFNDG